MSRILTTHVGSLPRTQDVVDFIFARENATPFDPAAFDATMTWAVDATVRRQVEAGATHITFGDPDFFNGIGHALQIGINAPGEKGLGNGGLFQDVARVKRGKRLKDTFDGARLFDDADQILTDDFLART